MAENNEKIFNKDDFLTDIQSIENEVSDIDNLYSEIKKHFDGIKNSQFKGSLSFIEKQTTNLVALKKAKLDLLNSKYNLKLRLIDTELKEKQINIKENSSNDSEFLAEELLKKLKNYSNIENNNLDTENTDDEEYYEDELSELNERAEKIGIDTSSILDDSKPDLSKLNQDNRNIEENLDADWTVVYDEDSKSFLAVDSDYNIKQDLGIKYDVIEKEFITMEDSQYAKSKFSDKYYLVVGSN